MATSGAFREDGGHNRHCCVNDVGAVAEVGLLTWMQRWNVTPIRRRSTSTNEAPGVAIEGSYDVAAIVETEEPGV
jgi:hypothetical protein